jgi:hypothetical protein
MEITINISKTTKQSKKSSTKVTMTAKVFGRPNMTNLKKNTTTLLFAKNEKIYSKNAKTKWQMT